MAKKTFIVNQKNVILKVGVVPTKLDKGTEYKAEEKNVAHLVKRGKLVLASKAKAVDAPSVKDDDSQEQ